MSLIQVAFGSDEWEVAFFHSVQSKLMLRLDEIEPGFVSEIYEKLGDDSVYILFKEACSQFGFEIAKDKNDHYWLIKTPGADLASSSIYNLVNRYQEAKGLNDEEFYKVEKSGKSHFSMLAQNYLKSSDAKFIVSKNMGDGSNYWEFSDKSCLELSFDGIKIWNNEPKMSELEFDSFIENYKSVLDKGLIQDSSVEYSM